MKNIIMGSDSYKFSHYKQYPPGTTGMFSYIEARGGEYDTTLFFGLQAALQEYLCKQVTYLDVNEALSFCEGHGVPFNLEGWMHIVSEHGGKLPVRIKAAPEGAVIPTGNILLSIESTDPKVFWVASFLETMLLRAIWYPTTVATTGYHLKQLFKAVLMMTCDNWEQVLPFMLHDFGARGVSSLESAAVGGAAHLVNFRGTDNVAGAALANKHYFHPMSGFSAPAAEHSTITSWGKDREVFAYRNMLEQYASPGGTVAVVSDSYDIFNACEHLWGGILHKEVVDSGATVVIRPDSGDPVKVVREVVSILAEKFGCTTNSKGYRVLNHVRVLQGDGVNPVSISKILSALVADGFSCENVTYGMGGALLQKVDRDQLSFAMKCSAVRVDDQWVDVYKQPITQKSKNSMKGRLSLYKKDGEYRTITYQEFRNLPTGDKLNMPEVLDTVFENGEIKKTYTLDEIRERVEM